MWLTITLFALPLAVLVLPILLLYPIAKRYNHSWGVPAVFLGYGLLVFVGFHVLDVWVLPNIIEREVFHVTECVEVQKVNVNWK